MGPAPGAARRPPRGESHAPPPRARLPTGSRASAAQPLPRAQGPCSWGFESAACVSWALARGALSVRFLLAACSQAAGVLWMILLSPRQRTLGHPKSYPRSVEGSQALRMLPPLPLLNSEATSPFPRRRNPHEFVPSCCCNGRRGARGFRQHVRAITSRFYGPEAGQGPHGAKAAVRPGLAPPGRSQLPRPPRPLALACGPLLDFRGQQRRRLRLSGAASLTLFHHRSFPPSDRACLPGRAHLDLLG